MRGVHHFIIKFSHSFHRHKDLFSKATLLLSLLTTFLIVLHLDRVYTIFAPAAKAAGYTIILRDENGFRLPERDDHHYTLSPRIQLDLTTPLEYHYDESTLMVDRTLRRQNPAIAIPTGIPTPTPLTKPVTTTTFKIAESLGGLEKAPLQLFISNPMIAPYELVDQTYGTKIIWVQFFNSIGKSAILFKEMEYAEE